jgi:hypothetical protein
MLGASDSPAPRSHERTRPDRSSSWDSHMADTITFLISARASLLELASETPNDPQEEGVLTSVSVRVEEALSALDDLSVANWVQGGCVGSRVIRLHACQLGRCVSMARSSRDSFLLRSNSLEIPGPDPDPDTGTTTKNSDR